MFKHFLRIASRNLLKRKFYSFINITGLAIGIACCLLIALYIKHELSFDRYHANHARIYRVLQTYRSVEKGQKPPAPAPQDFQVWGCAPVGPALAADFPEVEQVAQMMSPISLLLQTGDKRLQQDNLVCTDSTVFKVFSWKLLQGDARTALTAPNSIVLTEQTAHKLFGNANAVGQTLRANNQENLMVTGVVQNVPSNSQVTFNGLISMATAHKWQPDVFKMWGYVDFYTYVLLKKNTHIKPMQTGIPAFLKRHTLEPGFTIAFEPLDDAYLHSKAQRQPGPVGSMLNIYLFSCIGIIILLIACVNFMNLSTARSLERAKEVGVRKVLGVTPSALRRQFLLESFIIALVAGVGAVLFTKLALPLVSQLSGKAFAPETLLNGHFAWWVIAIIILTGLLAGTYPAWFLSRFRPVAVLKGAVRPSRGSMSLRKALVVFQFTLSVTLIAGTIIVYA
jgi:putative ABC transport system permease protein